jgi:colanic acid/amylovoran biosynthesis glycosyltransferase
MHDLYFGVIAFQFWLLKLRRGPANIPAAHENESRSLLHLSMPTFTHPGDSTPGVASAQALQAPSRSIAYLVSRYPTLSMIFVLREVVLLRALGFRIETASINPPDRPPERLIPQEREESERTYCIKRHGIPGALLAHIKTLLQTPAGYLRGLALVFSLSRVDLGRLFLNFMYFSEATMVGQWMRLNRQSHLHVHLASQAATVGLFVQRTFRCGYSLTVHGPDEFYDTQGFYLSQKISAADFIVCISSYARSQLMYLSPQDCWKKLHVCRLGIDPNLFSPLPRPTSLDSVPNDATFEILCVGRLTPAKGQHLLIDALHQLLAQGRNVRLRLAGNGPDEDSLRTHAARLGLADRVVFEGAVNQDRIRSVYARADVFCLPSFAEGLPVVLMEAMSMGIPCVTTAITGIPELIRHGIEGLLVPPSDLDALVSALATLIDDEGLRSYIAMNARQRILEQYDLRTNVEKLAAIFAEQIKPQN